MSNPKSSNRKPPKRGHGECYCGQRAIGKDSSGPYCARCEAIEKLNNPQKRDTRAGMDAVQEGEE